MLPVIEEICRKTGDKIIIRKYNRLSTLLPSKQALKSYRNIQSGDCVVGFSRRKLYDIKHNIEKESPGTKCCVI